MAATREYVIISDRELNDSTDVFRCYRADTGKEVWVLRYPAPGNLDYGNSPRATPVISDGLVYLHGAFGTVTCVELATGKSVWDINTKDEFEPTDIPKWGTCSTPLLVGEKLIVNPGARDASVVALEAKSGKVLWKAPGKPAGYGSFIFASLGSVDQVVGYDADSLGGWDPVTGKRLWRLVPERPSDFNVPTPIPVEGKLLVTTENNGTRLYGFDHQGRIVSKPEAVNRRLAPDTHTPVVAAGRVFGIWRRLYCLDLKADLKSVWDADDPLFTGYCSAVTDGKRVLVVSLLGEMVLIDAQANEFTPLGRTRVFDGEKGLYSHPAFVGSRAYVRGSGTLACLELAK